MNPPFPSLESISKQITDLTFSLELVAALDDKADSANAVKLAAALRAPIMSLLGKVQDYQTMTTKKIEFVIFNLVQTNKKIPAIKYYRALSKATRLQILRNYNYIFDRYNSERKLESMADENGLATAKKLVETVGKDFDRI